MKINRHLVPIKAHFFFFMAAMGPILPQLPVLGKDLGVSSIVMGSITGLLPIAFLLAKPAFGMLIDVYRDYRKFIFMVLIVIMTLSYAMMYFIPARAKFHFDEPMDLVLLELCNDNDLQQEQECNNRTTKMMCESSCLMGSEDFLASKITNNTSGLKYRLCALNESSFTANTCNITCTEDTETVNGCLYRTSTFWMFVVLMSVGTIGFNVVNSISDAICFDVIGDTYDYGKQRVWGTIGFGLTALLSGLIVNLFSDIQVSYTPAFIILIIFSFFDFLSCIKLKLPVIESPENIMQDMKNLLNNRKVVTFLIFAVFAGIVDSFIIYFLFWYLEDLASSTNTLNIKLLEGLIVAAETLGGELLFFSIAGKILERIGHVHCFSMCFLNYALRLGLISIAPSPWWILPIEFIFQGPTYALTYTTIVAYANELAPPGASATMQGIAAGLDDGIGYAIGSFLGGVLYKYYGGRNAMQVFTVIAITCSIVHLVLHKTVLKEHTRPDSEEIEYKSPEDAVKATYEIVT